jgi:hypothetical protein
MANLAATQPEVVKVLTPDAAAVTTLQTYAQPA